MSNKDESDFIMTSTKNRFYYSDFNSEDILVEDVGNSLSNQPRYCGHTNEFYSIAEHSVILSLVVPDSLKKYALMHDASEAYISDLPHPVKCKLSDYTDMEERIMDCVMEKFDLTYPDSGDYKYFKKMDRVIVVYEMRELFDLTDNELYGIFGGERNLYSIYERTQDTSNLEKYFQDFEPSSPAKSKYLFFNRFEELFNEVVNE